MGFAYFRCLVTVVCLALSGAATAHAQDVPIIAVQPSDGGPPIALYKKSYALVIGIGDYGGRWQTLTNAVVDAEIVAKELEDQGFEVRLERNLAFEELQKVFQEWFYLAGQEDDARLLVWFAGHGYTIQREGVQNPNGYIVAADAPNPNSVPSEQRRSVEIELRRRSLPMSRFAEYMKEATAKHVLMVFDSCFSGTVFSGLRASPSPAITRFTALPARQFITSGTAAQTVRDDGLFQRLFIGAITGKERDADPNADGYITGNELGNFLQQKLTNFTRNRQTPTYGPLREDGFDRGDFVFISQKAIDRPDNSLKIAGGKDETLWIFVRDLDSLDALDKFLTQYPKTAYRPLAEAKIAQLRSLAAPPVGGGGSASSPRVRDPNRATQPTITGPGGDQKFSLVRIMFATNRNRYEGGFGSERSKEVTFGEVRISVPPTHATGIVEMPTSLHVTDVRLYTAEPDPSKFFSNLGIKTFTEQELDDEISAATFSDGNDALLFVHGYNSSFDQASFRAAQIAYDLRHTGPVVLFSWPSSSTISGYTADVETLTWSEAHLVSTLTSVLQALSPGRRLHILAHGTGMKSLITAVKAMLDTPLARGIGEIVGIAPDVDAALFDRECPALRKTAKGITIYGSSVDKALLAAEKILGGRRAGLITADGPSVNACADVIDITGLDRSWFSVGHTTALESSAVLNDLHSVLKSGLRPPSARSSSIVHSQTKTGLPYYRFAQ